MSQQARKMGEGDDLRDELERIDQNVEGAISLSSRLKEQVGELEARVGELEDRLSNAERFAETALAVANEQSQDGEDVTKKRVCLINTRDELVKRAAIDTSAAGGSGLTIDEVTDMAKPHIHVYPQTVLDAWDELAASWGCFEVGKNEGGKTRCRVETAAIPEELARLVEHSLGRDDIAKRLMSRRR